MKKTARIFALVLAFASLSALCSQAAYFEYYAEDLKEIGVFKGTEKGFDLDRAPTRAEAAVMLVRLLGKETVASADYAAKKISHPFKDVDAWAAPHVAYLYTNGLTNGVSAAAFGSSQICSAQMYLTFALRALGYSDKAGGDFTYNDATTFALKTGLIDSVLLAQSFTRDTVVAVSYQTLASYSKGSSTVLAEKLLSEGALQSGDVLTEFIAEAKEYHKLAELETKTMSQSSLRYEAVWINGYTDLESKYNLRDSFFSKTELYFDENGAPAADLLIATNTPSNDSNDLYKVTDAKPYIVAWLRSGVLYCYYPTAQAGQQYAKSTDGLNAFLTLAAKYSFFDASSFFTIEKATPMYRFAAIDPDVSSFVATGNGALFGAEYAVRCQEWSSILSETGLSPYMMLSSYLLENNQLSGYSLDTYYETGVASRGTFFESNIVYFDLENIDLGIPAMPSASLWQ